jgi:HlyD family secretion protein
VQALYADFNHVVKKGQLIAKLDPSIIETQLEQSRANLVRSEAELERLKVSYEDTKVKLERTRNLFEKKLATQSELDAAVVAMKSAEVQIRSQEAAIVQSRASLKQAEVNLEHTDIYCPIDGIVINRAVDVGQTVAASMQAPTLFLIASDLSRMQVKASVDEADVGKIRPNQHVTFRVDAYPQQEFQGTVSQVRLQPVVTQNVVTYVTVIDVPNPDLRLKPGMTATVTIEIARRDRKWNDDGARKQLVQFFEAWGPTDEATVAGRKRLSSVLFA